VLLSGDAVAGGLADLVPSSARENGLEDPLEIESPVVKDAELNVRGDSGPWVREDAQKVRGRGLDESP